MERIGQVNVYGCPQRSHGAQMTTVNLADGVTPFMAGKCSRCGEPLCSSMYRMQLNGITRLPVLITITHGWYRPRACALHEVSREHVLHGGLLLAELREAMTRQVTMDPVTPGMRDAAAIAALEVYYSTEAV